MPASSSADEPGSSPRAAAAQAQSFARNTDLEVLLARINGYLRQAELAQPEPPPLQHPVILLVGAPRSGTTLFMQWLQSTGRIAVPTNLISRFYAAPAFGVMLRQLLFDPRYRYRGELDLAGAGEREFESELGKSRGPLGHNGFFFFWREFFPLGESRRLADAEIPGVDVGAMRRACARFAAATELPLAMKAYLVQYHLRLLEQALDRVLFVHITRDPTAVMSSLLQVRRSLCGDEDHWWGCRPPGIEAVAYADPALQVAGQVALTDQSIRAELGAIPAHKQFAVRYEELCETPADVWRRLRERIVEGSADPASAAARLGEDYVGPTSFRRSDKAVGDRARLEAAWAAIRRG